MGNRILWAVIIGILGVVLLPYLKEPVEFLLSTGGPYSSFVQLFVDNIYLVMFGFWIIIILLLVLWRRKSPTDEG